MLLYDLHNQLSKLHRSEDLDTKVPQYFWHKYLDYEDELKKREDGIATSAKYSYLYAKLLHKAFPKGEDVIAKNSFYSYAYARDALGKKPFPKGEKAIAKDSEMSYLYSKYILKTPWPMGEDSIAKDGYYSYQYAIGVLNERFIKGEAIIKRYPLFKINYEKIFGINL